VIRLQSRTLFGRTLVTIAAVSLVFQLFALTVFAFFLLFPLGQRATEDLVSVMIDTATDWSRAADKQSVELTLHLRQLHLPPAGLRLSEPMIVLPYIGFLEAALHRQLEGRGKLWTSTDAAGEAWYWADIPVDGAMVRLGFPRSRVAVRPPEALMLVLAVGVIVTISMVIVLVHRLTRPLDRLAAAVRRMGQGPWPEPLAEDGPEELAELARSFNRMSGQVQELLANRTTLLAGISHDLRTPLARIGLALEMIPRQAAPELITGIERDLDEMNRLLGLFLDVSRGMERGASEKVDLAEMLRGLADDARRSGAMVRLCEQPPCCSVLVALPLRRVLCNLIENAVRYSAPGAVDVECECGADMIEIRVLDRGPGIPEQEREQVFRPFYRLERSRSHRTGGSGLGLAIARQLADANGWQVALRPRTGGGTCALVTLPGASLRGESAQQLFDGGDPRLEVRQS
jgi:two-component system osmolarity sensor histidine kinase EnvZ